MSDYKIDTLEVETQIIAPAATTSVAGLHSATDKTKIDSVQSGATANQTDAFLLSRTNHTGTQLASTISNFNAAASAAAPVQSVAGQTGTVVLTKSDVGLANVDNTSDANKPISTATQTALNLKYDTSNPNGYETLAQLNSRDTNNRARANHTGTQLSTTISDFSESVDDRVATLLQPGTNISLVYDDVLNTLTITSAGTYTDEQAQDAVGTILVDTASVDLAYNDATPSITATVLPAGVNHNALQNYVANEHINHTAVSINAGTGLTGGGDITTTRTISMTNVGTAGTFGSATQVPVITTDAQGRVSGVTNTTITGVPATNITNTPAGNIVATNVQTAINELDGDKANLIGGNAFTGNQSVTSGSVAVGTVTQVASSILTLDSTTQGFLIPRMTSAQRIAIASPAEGLQVFDTDLNTMCEYSGTAWKFEYRLNTTAIQTSLLVAYANITELVSLSLDAGLYALELKGIMQSTATGTGVGLKLANGTATISTIVLNWGFTQAAAGTDKMFEYSQLAVADNVTSLAVITANTNFPVFGNGVFRITAAGTVAIQIRTEVAASGVSIRPDSTLMLKKIG